MRGQSIGGETIIGVYVDALPKMLRRVSSVQPPFIYHLNKHGQFTIKLAGKRIPKKHRIWRA